MHWRLLLGAICLCSLAAQADDAKGGIFFDDFSYADTGALLSHGWRARVARGHPGVPGAEWSPAAVSLVDDVAQAGNRVLRLTARTDGTPEGTQQAQVCHARKYLEGTYAARIRFTDDPVSGADGDPVIETFYAVAPLRHDFDPQFSEFDWEYLPNGGWGAPETRLYGISWQTVQIEPWHAYNQLHQEFGSHAGWHVLMMQIANGRTDPLPPGFEITGAHLEQTAKAQGVDVRRGDSVLVRTGWGQYFAKDNAKYLGEQSPGPGQDGARWIIDRGVRLAGDDTATFEKRPAAYGKELFSVHMMLLADNGIYIVENCNLEAMADAKAYVALLILTPLRIQGATGSPLRAIALAP